MFYLNIILFALPFFHPNEEKWLYLPVDTSFEYAAIGGKGAFHLPLDRQFFNDKNLTIKHMEVIYTMESFGDEEELLSFLEGELPDGKLAFDRLKKQGWLEIEGKILFPRKQLLVLLKKGG